MCRIRLWQRPLVVLVWGGMLTLALSLQGCFIAAVKLL